MRLDTGQGLVRRRIAKVAGADAAPWRRQVVFAVLFAVSVYVGRLTTDPESGMALVWPAAGVGFVWYLTSLAVDRRIRVRWIGITTLAVVLLSLVLNTASGMAVDRALAFGAGNVLSGLLGALVYHRWDPTTPLVFTRRRHGAPLVLASVAAGVGSAVGGPLYSVWLGSNTLPMWQALARSGVGCLVFGVLILRMLGPRSTLPRPRLPARLGLACATVVGYGLAFFGLPEHKLAFVLIAVTVLAALVLTVDELLLFLVVLGGLLVFGTLRGMGPFAIGDPQVQVFIAQAFVGLNTLIGLLLVVGRSDQHVLIGELRDERRRSDTQRALVDHVISTIPDAVVAVEGDRVAVANGAAGALFGLHVGDSAQGSALMGGDEGGRPIDRALRGESVHDDVVLPIEESPETERTVLSVRGIRLHGTHDQAVVVARDVTEQRRRVAELSGFASVVAHDLLNPLGGVEGWLEVLEEEVEGTSPLAESSVRRARNSTARMRDIVTGLHNYSVARGGELSFVDLDLQELAESLAEGRTAADHVCPSTAPDITVDARRRVHADRALLAQVIDNLVGNAVKYSRPGTAPRIHVSATGPVDGMVTVRIDDAGIGIPEADRQKVFDEFHRVEGHREAFAGTGLGLSICARMVARHGGTIRADASPLGGTRMEFTIPAAQQSFVLDDEAMARAQGDLAAEVAAEVGRAVRRHPGGRVHRDTVDR